jgi:hypothetical protein
MLDAWNRVEHYRDLAEECRRVATFSFSGQMRNRYSHVADQYGMLACGRGAEHPSCQSPSHLKHKYFWVFPCERMKASNFTR